jgi:tripartite-type tricarboxylate transporter receptor subunit TctC
MSGEIPISINPMAEVIGQIEGGTVRPVAVTSEKRSDVLPNVPTVAESGVPRYDASVWWGFLGPAGMPNDITAKLHHDLSVALQDANVVAYLKKTGSTAVGSSPQEFEAYIRAEAEKWGPVIKAANIKAE